MEYVEAIRDIKHIQAMKKVLKMHSQRDYLLFVLGINTGIKITEMLDIKVSDVAENNGKVKDSLHLFCMDKNKQKSIHLNRKAKAAIKEYLAAVNLNQDDYLFKSSKTDKPISRQQAYRIINDAAKEIGITAKIGTNSLRKTFGFHAYKRGVAISLLQEYFHHSTPAETMKYIGVTKAEKIVTEIDVNL
ncbi:tyrosine-type recombinase/integrase [Bacillus sp. V33-4]|uniref:tyrosine-type recombinase/integrase n=1 Tax=Bacillus sp. V33-4 TaxID=2054169 RepID=UPI000C780A4F|nr:tyrosine-type recombinase/integrase [Bacillus sp. V33-4]PLR81898.1 site-specific integrase [Bacillus sp. V33-4]